MSDLSLRMKQAWQTRLDGEILYFFAFVLYFFFSFIRNTTFNPYIGARPFNLVSYMVVGLLVIKIYIFDRQQLKSVFLTTIGLGISVVSWRMSGSNLIIVMMAFILGARNI
ncbi:MAG: polymerase, partial [Limosilactobacillus mucosae]